MQLLEEDINELGKIMKKIEIPSHLQIETVRSCNAKCTMCPLNYAQSELEIKRGVMSEKDFKIIIDKFIPYAPKIKFVSLIGIGEPLLDKGLFEKIKYLKKRGFRNTAIATNADLLNEKKQAGLLRSGVDTIICSVDGIDKKTHESIRLKTNFERVVENIQACIKQRDEGNYKSRFLIRMIKQKSNYSQWAKYVSYWEKFIDRAKRDDIIAFDIHNWSGTRGREEEIDYRIPCSFMLEKLSIAFNGDIYFCFDGGILKYLKTGNALTENPLAVYNKKVALYSRAIHREGLRGYLYLCRGCNVPNQRKRRIASTSPKNGIKG